VTKGVPRKFGVAPGVSAAVGLAGLRDKRVVFGVDLEFAASAVGGDADGFMTPCSPASTVRLTASRHRTATQMGIPSRPWQTHRSHQSLGQSSAKARQKP
jgi:hypothetical protein